MINEIEIIDYKGFKNLKLDNLSQINIISGENNIGKTALLEALFLYKNIDSEYDFVQEISSLEPFLFIAKNRDITEDKIEKYLKNILFSIKTNKLEINIHYKNFIFFNKQEVKTIKNKLHQGHNDFIICYINNTLNVLPTNTKDEPLLPYKSYINSSKPTKKKLVELYSNIQSKGLQQKFLTYLKLLDNDIEWIEPQLLDDEMLLRINLKNPERSLVSSELGEGTNRYIEILATLLSNSNGTVFIDEVENGIHYTKLYDVWKAIIEIVQKEEIQLFVTTHDRESIEALAEASQDMNFNQVTSIKLEKNSENNIYPIIRPYSSFLATVDSGMDIR